jgi:hypothetical protein
VLIGPQSYKVAIGSGFPNVAVQTIGGYRPVDIGLLCRQFIQAAPSQRLADGDLAAGFS